MLISPSRHLENWPIYFLGLAALMGSIFPVQISSGLEFTLAPLLYLFALRIWGRNTALIIAIITMLPTLWWWDHSYALIASLGILLLADILLKRFNISITLATIIFYASLGLVINALYFFEVMDIPLAMAVIIFSKKAINDLALAACADFLIIFWERALHFPYIQKQKSISLRAVMGSAITTAIFLVAFVLYISQSRYYIHQLKQYSSEVEIAAHKWVLSNPSDSRPFHKISLGENPDNQSDMLLFKGDARNSPDIIQRELGCNSVALEKQKQYGFLVWNNICLKSYIATQYGDYSFVYSPRIPLLQTVHKLIEHLFLLLGLMLLAFGLRTYVMKLISQSLESWDSTLNQFGSAARKPALPVPLKEFIDPIQKFIYTNNSYVELEAKQKNIENSIRELQKALDLHFISDISWNEENNSIQFQQLDSINGPSVQVLRLHPVDQTEFKANLEQNETVLEFRSKYGESNSWYMIILKDHVARGVWKNGLILKLRASRLITENLAHQSRLVELGSMASAISHELKQPLFTIALAAENALHWLNQKNEADQEKALLKITKVIKQVTRAKDIIERMTHYARAGSSRIEIIDVVELTNSVARFMRPIFVHNNIHIEIRYLKTDICRVHMSRLALEQILSNVLQNAIDAITERALKDGQDGYILIKIEAQDNRIVLIITDNGIGLNHSNVDYAFDAFYTTKAPGQGTGLGLFISRQFIEEAGGKLYLSANSDQLGASLRIELPIVSA